MHSIGERQRHAAGRGFDAVRLADVLQTLVVVAEPEAPFGLDRPRWRFVDHLDNALGLALGDLRERVFKRRGGSRIAVPVERHVGQAAMRRDGRRLPFRALQRRHIGRGRFLRDLVIGDIERAHGTPPTISAAPWHTELAFSRPWFCGHAPRLPRKCHRDRPNVPVQRPFVACTPSHAFFLLGLKTIDCDPVSDTVSSSSFTPDRGP